MRVSGNDKSNVAIIVPGGLGTGKNNIGVPVLEQIIKSLSKDFRLTVFQLYKINKDYQVNGFELISIYSTNRFIKGLKFLAAFWKKHKEKKFSIVHGFWALPCGFFAVIVGKCFRMKSIVSVLGGDAVSLPEIHYGQLRSQLNKKLILWTLNNASQVNALTQYLINNLKIAGLTRSDISVIPWGVDPVLFSFREKEMKKPIQFLHIANLHPVKDQETLLRAFKKISANVTSQLTLIGEGISKNYVRSLIEELDLENNVIMLDLLPYEQLPAYYHQADILLHTSLSEGQSEVVTEAMSCGVLVCGTKVGLMYDLPDCCISVPVKDYHALGLGVLQLVFNPKLMRTLRQNAKDWTNEHCLSWSVEEIKRIYSKGIMNE